MELTDKREISAPRSDVWSSLLDPLVLRDCIPGCRELTGSPEEGFEAVVVQKVGPVKATFRGRVTIEDMEEPEALTLVGEGKGGPAGFAKGSARVRLSETGGVTLLHYEAEAKVGGKLAQLGGRVVDAFAAKMADAFFESFERRVEGAGGGGGAGEEVPTPGAQAMAGVSATGPDAGAAVAGGPATGADVEGMASTGRSSPPPGSRDPSDVEVPATPGAAGEKKGWLGRLLGR